MDRRDDHDKYAAGALLGPPSDSDARGDPPGSCPGGQTDFKPAAGITNEVIDGQVLQSGLWKVHGPTLQRHKCDA